MAFANGISIPPTVTVTYELAPMSATTQLYSLRLQPGSAPGTLLIGWPSAFAEEITASYGLLVAVALDGEPIMRGAIVTPAVDIHRSGEETRATVACDKWRMAARVLGEPGIGTVPAEGDDAGSQGFTDAGFDLVFNAGGRPDKAAADSDFSRGAAAVAWKLVDILTFIFAHYVDPLVAALPAAFAPGVSWDATPPDLDLTGLTVPQAIDALCQLAGDQWTLTYGELAVASEFTLIRPGLGTARTVALFAPEAGASATAATELHADAVSHEADVSQSRDKVQVVSARAAKETTYFSFGEDSPLLDGSDLIADKDYAVRFSVAVANYPAHGLGPALTAGSPALPWLQRLLTRQDEATGQLVTAAALAADPTKRAWPGLEKPYIWMTLDKDAEPRVWRLVAGGYRIDFEHAFIDFQSTFELYSDDGSKEQITRDEAGSWSSIGIACTVATVLLLPESAGTADVDLYLPAARTVRVDRADLVPERREFAVLPDLSSDNPNAFVTVAELAEEAYVDVAPDLEQAVDASSAAESAVSHQARIEFPFLPAIALGDRVSFSGRLATLPEMMVGSLSYVFHQGSPLRLVCAASTSIARLGGERRLP